MKRDLHFHPCTNTAPSVLTRGQVEQFNRDGYLRGIRVFPSGSVRTRGGFEVGR